MVTYGLIYLVMVLIQNVLVFYWHRRVMPGIRMTVASFRREKVVEILSFSGHTSLARLSNLLYDSTANVIINIFWGPSYNAVYSVSLKIPQIMKRLFMDSTWTLTPTFTSLVARNNKEKTDLLFFMYTKVVALVTMPLCLAIILFSEQIISLWVGPEFTLAGKLLPLHMAPLVLIIPFSVCGCLNNAYAKVKIPSIVGFAVALLNLGLGVLLGFTFDLKLYGISIASSAALLIFATLFTPYYACKIANISLSKYWLKGLIKPLIWTCFVGAAALFVLKIAPSSSVLYAVLGVLSMTAVYYTGAFAFILDEHEKKQIYDGLRNVFNFYHKAPKRTAVDVGQAR
jgi:O-antigen/teichoic acid export membrane protein